MLQHANNATRDVQRIGVIDLGSNTARLIIMRAIPGFAFRLEDEIREVVRLREGMTDDGLSKTAVSRAFFALRLFKRYSDSKVDKLIATATSAVRDAANGQQFIQRVQQELGLTLQILDGEKEAYYGTLGALNDSPLAQGFVLDIGGGSAQLSQVRNQRYARGVSKPLGALALTERFVKHDPVTSDEISVIQNAIDAELDAIKWLRKKPEPDERTLVGIGGTIRNLAKIAIKQQDYPLETLHGFPLHLKTVDDIIAQLQTLPQKEREKIKGLSRDRADIILPGAMVLRSVMKRLKVDRVHIAVNGLREGLFLEHFWAHLAYPAVANVRRFSVLNFARTYDYQKAHANHVRYLAGRLFDEMRGLHHFQALERELLRAAALLHDIGVVIQYNDHHKHGQTLILNNGLAGYSPRETAVIALLVRYHRKGTPSTNGYKSLLDDGDEQRLFQLAAILRLAEFLERGRNGNVDDVTVTWDEQQLRLTLIADQYPAVEMWGVQQYAVELLEAAFEREVVLESTAVSDY